MGKLVYHNGNSTINCKWVTQTGYFLENDFVYYTIGHRPISQDDNNTSNNNIRTKYRKKPLFYRIWKYLKSTWTGVLTGNGKSVFYRLSHI